MGIELKRKRQLIERLNRRLLSESEMDCPKATQDLELNTKNRDMAIEADYIKYGPLNVDEPANYWDELADHWKTSVEAANLAIKMVNWVIAGCIILNATQREHVEHGLKVVQ